MDKNKFREDGTAIPYYGNTIISFLNHEDDIVYNVLNKIQTVLKETEYKDYFSYLPPSSYHMTIIGLCRMIDKNTEFWPKWIDTNRSFKEIDLLIKEKVDRVKKPHNIVMKIDNIDTEGLKFIPANKQVAEELKRYRDEISQITGIIHPEHDEYRFHATTTYTVKEIPKFKESLIDDLMKELLGEIKEEDKTFNVPEPKFVIFNDMLSYETDLSKRGDMY